MNVKFIFQEKINDNQKTLKYRHEQTHTRIDIQKSNINKQYNDNDNGDVDHDHHLKTSNLNRRPKTARFSHSGIKHTQHYCYEHQY